MQEREEVSNTEFIKSPVWTDPEAADAIVVHEGARIAAHFNPDGMVVIVQEDAFGDDQAVVFGFRHINSLILKLQELSAMDIADFMSDDCSEALQWAADKQRTGGE